MVARTGLFRLVLLCTALLATASSYGQNELRNTFFKEADAAKAAADAENAELYAPRSYENGMKEYRDAEELLERGRNIEYVRSNAADATRYLTAAAKAAQLAQTALAQAIKSRQDGANPMAPKLSPELWADAQREFQRAINLLERGDLKMPSAAR